MATITISKTSKTENHNPKKPVPAQHEGARKDYQEAVETKDNESARTLFLESKKTS